MSTKSFAIVIGVLAVVGLLAYGLLGLSFTGFAARMLLPQLAALAVNIGLFFVIFRRDLPPPTS